MKFEFQVFRDTTEDVVATVALELPDHADVTRRLSAAYMIGDAVKRIHSFDGETPRILINPDGLLGVLSEGGLELPDTNAVLGITGDSPVSPDNNWVDSEVVRFNVKEGEN
jgi:hypothetical protein